MLCARQAPGQSLPDWVGHQLPGATLVGKGRLRYFGLDIYEARLWAQAGFAPARYDAFALALQLSYHYAFTSQQIARRSVLEMQRQHALQPEQAARWQARLAQLMPDVRPGDSLGVLYRPGQGLQLWQGAQLLGTLPDAGLARLFVGIWLSPRTSEPALRQELLGGGPQALR